MVERRLAREGELSLEILPAARDEVEPHLGALRAGAMGEQPGHDDTVDDERGAGRARITLLEHDEPWRAVALPADQPHRVALVVVDVDVLVEGWRREREPEREQREPTAQRPPSNDRPPQSGHRRPRRRLEHLGPSARERDALAEQGDELRQIVADEDHAATRAGLEHQRAAQRRDPLQVGEPDALPAGDERLGRHRRRPDPSLLADVEQWKASSMRSMPTRPSATARGAA